MKVEITPNAEVSITSSSKEERLFLLEIYGKSQKSKATALVNVIKANDKAKKKRAKHLKSCDVIGCNKKYRGDLGIASHKTRAHGLSKDGKVSQTYMFKGKEQVVPNPVVMDRNGNFALRVEGDMSFHGEI